MPISSIPKRLLDAYRFVGFRPLERVRGDFGHPQARIIPPCPVVENSACGHCAWAHSVWYDRKRRGAHALSCGDIRAFEVRREPCPSCGAVKRERPEG